jgi:hypothetical protein
MSAALTREELIAAATELHDRECQSCDRKYRMSCPNMASAILRSGQVARTRDGGGQEAAAPTGREILQVLIDDATAHGLRVPMAYDDHTDENRAFWDRLAARLAVEGWRAGEALAAAPGGSGQADPVAAERERIRQLAIACRAVTVSPTGRMTPFAELLERSPEENAAALLKVVRGDESARAGLDGSQ